MWWWAFYLRGDYKLSEHHRGGYYRGRMATFPRSLLMRLDVSFSPRRFGGAGAASACGNKPGLLSCLCSKPAGPKVCTHWVLLYSRVFCSDWILTEVSWFLMQNLRISENSSPMLEGRLHTVRSHTSLQWLHSHIPPTSHPLTLCFILHLSHSLLFSPPVLLLSYLKTTYRDITEKWATQMIFQRIHTFALIFSWWYFLSSDFLLKASIFLSEK